MTPASASFLRVPYVLDVGAAVDREARHFVAAFLVNVALCVAFVG